ncbi:MAG: AbrB/MazE/SpoVT family DNA-binding domain-containing protein [Thaumarchaeota archaeon]|nr:AbrB/MazE/SpoVT family DNA-binding domain-containing protein [Nitrososphaerota archaeon]
MRQYQVTRKMQVTIPKRIAERTGIKPGDSVVFEETPDERIMIRKVSGSSFDAARVLTAFDNLASDMTKIRSHVIEARSGLIEGLSGYIDSQ